MNARLRSLTPQYKTTLPRDAGREIPEGRTLDLRSVTVEVDVENDAGDRSAFEFRFNVDHEESRLTLETVEPQYDDHAPAAELAEAANVADDGVHGWLLDVEADMRIVDPISADGVAACAHIFTDLRVSDK